MDYKVKKKVVFISEFMNSPFDEGIKKTVFHLYKLLNQHYQLLAICREGSSFLGNNIHTLKSNKLFLSKNIKILIKNFSPDVVLYFPFASTTFAGFLRNFVLSQYNKNGKTFMIAMQPKPLKKWQQLFIKLIKPTKVLTPSPQLINNLTKLNINSCLLPLFTDLKKFSPIKDHEHKNTLRKKYGLPVDKNIITHVGHLNEGRNLKSLIPIQNNKNQVFIVGSSSTPKDSIGHVSLKNALLEKGIIIHDAYIEKIEEVYQLSDIYIFPVEAQNSSIGLPLSILEARSCGIPVLTTNYGSIKHLLGTDHGCIYYGRPNNFVQIIEKIKRESSKPFQTSIHKLNVMFESIICKEIDSK